MLKLFCSILAHQRWSTYERKHVDTSSQTLKQFVKIRVQSCSIKCGCSSMVEQKLPKLTTGVRFPSPAPVPVLPPVSFLQQCTCLGSRHAVQIHHKKTNQCSLLENIKLLTVLTLQNFFTLQFTLQMQRIIQRSNWTLGRPGPEI